MFFSIKHKQSTESKTCRNKVKKLKRIEKKKVLLEQQHKIHCQQEIEIMELKRRNVLLSRTLRTLKKPTMNAGINSKIVDSSLCKSLLKAHQNKSANIIRSITHKVLEFNANDLMRFDDTIGFGASGTVKKGFIKGIQQHVAVNEFSKLSASIDIEQRQN